MSTAQQNAAAAQGRVDTGDAELDDLGAGTDPAFVQTIEHFEAMTHEQMYQAVHGPGGMDAAGLRTLQRTWFANYSELANLSTFNAMGLARIFGNGLWDGAAGAAAQSASTRLSAAANQIGRVFESVANRLDALSWSAEAVRAAVQPPPAAAPPPDPDNQVESILPGLINPEYDDQTRTAREQARQAVIRALNSAYTPVFPPAGNDVPSYTSVPHIGGTEASPGAPTNSGVSSSGPGTSPGTNDGATQQNPTGAAEPTQGTPTGSESPTAASGTGSPTVPSGLGLPEDLLSGAGQNTTPSSTTTPGGVGSASTPTSPTSPTLGPTGSRAGSSHIPGSGTPGTPSLGSRLPSSPLSSGIPNAATTATSASADRGTTRTPTGSMGPGAGTRGKKDDDENTHQAPDYLRQVYSDWTEGLGSHAGVIGADTTDFGLDLPSPRAGLANPVAAQIDSAEARVRLDDSHHVGQTRHEPPPHPEAARTVQRPTTATPPSPEATTPAVAHPAASVPPTAPPTPPATAGQDSPPSSSTGLGPGTARAPGNAAAATSPAGTAPRPADTDPAVAGGPDPEVRASTPAADNEPPIDGTTDSDGAGPQVVTMTGTGPFAGGGASSGDDVTTRVTAATSTEPDPDADVGRAAR